MDTHTGELLALADYPTFDANQPSLSPEGNLGSRALRDVYEPGSVEKVLTASSLIDAGKVTPNTKIIVPSSCRARDRVIHDYFVHPKLHLTLTGVIAKSSNIGTVLAASQFKHKELYDYLRKFGLGRAPASACGGETAGVLPSRQTGRRSTRTPSPSARASPSTPCRWPPRSTPSPTAAST